MVIQRVALLSFLGVFVVSCGEDRDFTSAALETPADERSEVEAEAIQRPSANDPRLIRVGRLHLEVDDLEEAISGTEEVVEQAQGFVAGSEFREGPEGSRTASLELRIPSDSFQETIDRLSELGHVLSVSVSASDVSREYFDLQTRVEVKEETVRRLQELMTRSGDLEDLLAVERELGRATTELESLKGQIQYYDQRTAFSQLSVSLAEPGAAIAPGLFRPVVRAFRDAAEVFAQSLAALVYIVAFLTPWVLLGILLLPLGRRLRSRIVRKRPESEAT